MLRGERSFFAMVRPMPVRSWRPVVVLFASRSESTIS